MFSTEEQSKKVRQTVANQKKNLHLLSISNGICSSFAAGSFRVISNDCKNKDDSDYSSLVMVVVILMLEAWV